MPEERKLVTILFADVTGSTALGESLDPEDVRALMGRYYAHAREVVASHGGTIEKFIGDAVMAVFGLTQAHGDDAERALAAAMALRAAVANDEVLNQSFQLRIGVNTGEVIATSDQSSGDFLITGDAVNVAARLQQHTNPGEITAGERTANAAQTAFAFDEPRMVEVKGKKLPLNEELGDYLLWGDAVVQGYSAALECWRAEGEQNPLVGARLLRKLLIGYRRASTRPERAELDALWNRARQLAEEAGDEGELWRNRVAAKGWLLQQSLVPGNLNEAEAQDALATCQAAAAFFEREEDWRFLDDTLDLWASFMSTIVAHNEALAICRRRLSTPGITTYERGDAIGTIAATYFLLGDYEHCIAITTEALAALHPGEPIEYFAGAVSRAMWAIYVAGRWDEVSPLLNALAQIWERLQLRPGAGIVVFDSFLVSFMLAKAREDRPAMDIAASALERMLPGDADARAFLSIMRDDDYSKFNAEKAGSGVPGLLISFFSEAGLQAPQKFMQGVVFQNDMTTWCIRIAQALIDDDNAQLARAIDDAEAHHLVVHAARMRVVLASAQETARNWSTLAACWNLCKIATI